ncbi:hypothetical protein P43SY_001474 [Pythium insidiosum]|uniref:Uncharacterized protein n=1 Tax=Pythium insidiosum TaxID=114742 RepID=A0AAD5M4T2_PYTIN|nr:hypothetical protein P43SY_001474 [Pythium insidiosum]
MSATCASRDAANASVLSASDAFELATTWAPMLQNCIGLDVDVANEVFSEPHEYEWVNVLIGHVGSPGQQDQQAFAARASVIRTSPERINSLVRRIRNASDSVCDIQALYPTVHSPWQHVSQLELPIVHHTALLRIDWMQARDMGAFVQDILRLRDELRWTLQIDPEHSRVNREDVIAIEARPPGRPFLTALAIESDFEREDIATIIQHSAKTLRWVSVESDEDLIQWRPSMDAIVAMLSVVSHSRRKDSQQFHAVSRLDRDVVTLIASFLEQELRIPTQEQLIL